MGRSSKSRSYSSSGTTASSTSPSDASSTSDSSTTSNSSSSRSSPARNRTRRNRSPSPKSRVRGTRRESSPPQRRIRSRSPPVRQAVKHENSRHRRRSPSPVRRTNRSRSKSPRNKKLSSPSARKRQRSPTERSRHSRSPARRRNSSPVHKSDRQAHRHGESHPHEKIGLATDSRCGSDRHGRSLDKQHRHGELGESKQRDDRHHGRAHDRQNNGDRHHLPPPPPIPPPASKPLQDLPPPPPIGGPPAIHQELLPAQDRGPDFTYTGKLADETNKVNGIVMKYQEPPEAAKPTLRWRLYIFKGGEMLGEPLYLHRQTWYLFGKDRRIADIPTDHPSISKQHAVLQYREVDVGGAREVKPYIIDLGSVNGTFINGEKVEASRYYELLEKDMLKFGSSTREYVLLHERSAG